MNMLANVTMFNATDGFEVGINDQMHITGIMAILYTNRIKNTTHDSSKLFQCSCFPSIIKTMIAIMVIQLVNKSHKIDVAQNINRFIPLTYCKNRALHPFSYEFIQQISN